MNILKLKQALANLPDEMEVYVGVASSTYVYYEELEHSEEVIVFEFSTDLIGTQVKNNKLYIGCSADIEEYI